jgi:hypothetical protein
LNHFDWEALNTIQDFLDARKIWLVKYPAQLLTYLWLHGEPWGLFWIKSKLTFRGKPILVNFEDFTDYMDEVFKRVQHVNMCLEMDETPVPIPYTPWMCDKCDMLKLCPNEKKMGEPLEIETSDQLKALLDERGDIQDQLKPLNKRFKFLDGEVKGYINEDRPHVACGDWELKRRVSQRKGYTVDPTEVVQVSVKKIKVK